MRFIILIISFLAVQQLSAQNEVHTIKVTKKKQEAAISPSVSSIANSTSTNQVFRVVEVMPRLDIGECNSKVTNKEKEQCSRKEMEMFVISNIRYPAEAKEAGIQGTVFISFVIKTDGTMADFKIVKDIGGGCGEEALRAAKLIGEQYRWMAGTQRGQAVDVLYNFPVKFGLK